MPIIDRKHVLKIAFICFTTPQICFGVLVDHLKTQPNKPKTHCMRNIDFIYMINLDERPEKFKKHSKEFHKYNIFPYRFSGVNGWQLTIEQINDVGLKYSPEMTPILCTRYPPEANGIESHEFMEEIGKTYFSHCMAKGTIGCALSHISVLYDAWNEGFETIWVLEDDAEIVNDPRQLSNLIETLDATVGKENWDVLFTDQNIRKSKDVHVPAYGCSKRPDLDCSIESRYSSHYSEETIIHPQFKKIGARFGTHSMIIRRSGIKKLLDFFLEHNIYLPIDMDNYRIEGLQRYGLTFDVVSNDVTSTSDNGNPDFINHKEK